MIKLSVNVITNSLSLLENINHYGFKSKEEIVSSCHYSINTNDLFELIEICKLIYYNNECFVVSKTAIEILSSYQEYPTEICYRKFIYIYLLNILPNQCCWKGRMAYGLKEAMCGMNEDEKKCFIAAGGLSDYPDRDALLWLKSLENLVRDEYQIARNESGIDGELLTVQYEERRVGIRPKWISIKTNKAGYDFVSKNEINDDTFRIIEVKHSISSVEKAMFYVSRNEWNVAELHNNYYFYLWCENTEGVYLAILNSSEIRPHIAINQAGGVWEIMKIPCQEFKNKFVLVTGLERMKHE